jgi:hypothetical protein
MCSRTAGSERRKWVNSPRSTSKEAEILPRSHFGTKPRRLNDRPIVDPERVVGADENHLNFVDLRPRELRAGENCETHVLDVTSEAGVAAFFATQPPMGRGMAIAYITSHQLDLHLAANQGSRALQGR